MWIHMKATIEVKVRNSDKPLDAPVEDLIEIWSDGRPCSDIQIKIGKALYCLPADELIDAAQRCSK